MKAMITFASFTFPRHLFGMLQVVALLAGLLGVVGCASQAQRHDHVRHPLPAESESPFVIPPPLVVEHDHLHAQLEQAIQAPGRTGEAARQVHLALADHFHHENELVMPLFGLLPELSTGRATEAMRPAVAMAKKVEQQLPAFLEDHKAIYQAVSALEAAAETEGLPEIVAFARRLRLHAQTEEAVLYPTAILIGRQVEQMLAHE